MADSSEKFGDTGVIELVGKIMVVAVVLLFFVVVFVFCLHLYAKHFCYRRRENPNTATASAGVRRFDFADGHPEIAVSRRGLDPSVLKTLPIIIFDPKQFKDGVECAVCLSEISQGEKTRLLPKCNHGFHLDCIDMWFESHSTCPLCRNHVRNQNQSNSGSEPPLEATIQATIVDNSGVGDVSPTEAPNFPTNVLIWGDETQVSTFAPFVEENNNHHQGSNAIIEPSSSSSSSMASASSTHDGISTVDIPRQINEDDEQKSSAPRRLRSLKRLLSYNNRRVNPSSPKNLDLEQGGGGRG